MFRKITFELPENVSVEIFDPTATDPKRQDSVWYDEQVALLTYKKGEIEESASVLCLGEMRLIYKDLSIYNALDLISAGIKNDKQLYKVEDNGGEWINNSWFEVLGDDENGDLGIYHTAKEAIEEGAKELVSLVEDNIKEGVYV